MADATSYMAGRISFYPSLLCPLSFVLCHLSFVNSPFYLVWNVQDDFDHQGAIIVTCVVVLSQEPTS